MALTQVSSKGIKDATLLNEDVNASANIAGSKLADNSISLAKLLHGDSNNNGKFLRANNGADPTFETIDLTALSASNLTSGTIPDARFPSTLPAISGANLTDLNASRLVSGTVPDARFPATLPAVSAANLTNIPAANITGTLPAIDGSNLTGISAGVTVSGNVNNRVITGDGTNLVGESGFTHDPSSQDTQIDGSNNAPVDLIIANTNNSQAAATARLHISAGDNANNGGQIELECNGQYHTLESRSNGTFYIFNNGTEALTLDNSNNMHLSLGSFVIGTSGEGLSFQNTSGSASGSDSSKLNDYEEGSWTPSVTFGGGNTGQSYGTQVGRYIKVGKLVHIQCYVTFTDKGSSTGTARLAGLPFTTRNQSSAYSSAPFAYFHNGNSSSGPGSISSFMAYTEINQTTLNIQREQLNQSTPEMNDAHEYNFAYNTEFMLTMTYVSN